MKGDFKKIVDKALASLRKTYKPFDDNIGEFVLVDREHAEEQLHILERAKENGEKNLPRTNQKAKDSIATDIDLWLNTCVSLGKTSLLNKVTTSNTLTDAQMDRRPSAQMQTEYENASSELNTLVRSSLNNLFSKKRKLVDVDIEYKNFKETNNLLGPAKYMNSKERFTHYGIIFLIFFIEILVNIFTLGEAHPESYFGVGFETTLFAAVNFAFGYSLGNFFLRQKNNKKIFAKVTGYLSVLLTIFLILVLNLFFGHYRDALGSFAAELQKTNVFNFDNFYSLGNIAKSKLIASPLSMNDFKSYLLFVAGVACSLYSAKEFYGMDDAYPGYGKLQRDRDKFDKDYSDYVRQTYDNCNDIVNQLRNDLIGGTDLEIAGQNAIGSRNREIESLIEKYKFWIQNIESTGVAMYARYHEETLKYRTDNKTPQCFKNEYKLPKDVFDIKLPKIEEQPADLTQNTTAKKLSAKIHSELENYLETMKSVQNLSADELKMDLLDEKISEIEKVSNKRIKYSTKSISFNDEETSIKKGSNIKNYQKELENKKEDNSDANSNKNTEIEKMEQEIRSDSKNINKVEEF